MEWFTKKKQIANLKKRIERLRMIINLIGSKDFPEVKSNVKPRYSEGTPVKQIGWTWIERAEWQSLFDTTANKIRNIDTEDTKKLEKTYKEIEELLKTINYGYLIIAGQRIELEWKLAKQKEIEDNRRINNEIKKYKN